MYNLIYKRMLTAEQESWKEWAFQFKTAVGAANNVIRERLDDIQAAGK